jgi:diacylglycerol kinase (ATP)
VTASPSPPQPPEPPTAIEWTRGDRVLAVVNPATRGDVDEIEDALAKALPPGVLLDLRLTTGPGEGRVLALDAAPGARMLVAVGGDGTVSELATAAVQQGIPLGIVPAGSTNIIARELGVPRRVDAAVRLLFGTHRLRRLDAGVCNERIFLHMAGAGFDSRFFALTNPRWKRRVGWPAYLPAAARALRLPAAQVRVVVDDKTLEVVSPLVLVANGMSIIHPRLRVHQAFRPDDGWLDVMAVTATTPLAIARTLGRLAQTQLHRSPYVRHMRSTKVTLETDPILPIQLDGDVLSETPATFEVRPSAVRFVVPEGDE